MSGSVNIIRRFIAKSNDFNWGFGLKGACYSGNMEAIN